MTYFQTPFVEKFFTDQLTDIYRGVDAFVELRMKQFLSLPLSGPLLLFFTSQVNALSHGNDSKVLCKLSSLHSHSLHLSFLFLPSLPPLDIFVAFFIAILFACCMYLRSQLCGDDEDDAMFTNIQLDEIRLEKVSKKERTILERMNQMKV